MQQPPAEEITHHFAGIFIITESGKVIGQLREDKEGIDHPGKVGLFGGSVEGDEDPYDAAWRELVNEETNLKLAKEDIHHFIDDVGWRELTREWEVRHFYYVRITDEEVKNLEVYEGQGWTYMAGSDDVRLVDVLRDPIKRFFNKMILA
jgi:ADP-ribose pyrophosphatase YjhB (NUDIX family)